MTKAPNALTFLRCRGAFVVVAFALFALLSAAAPALAASPVTVCPPGSGAGQCVVPRGVAVDNSGGLAQGDVYVADGNNERVDVFNSTGTFLRAFGWGVLNGASELQVCTTATGCRAGLPGAGNGQFQFSGTPTLAVDNTLGGEGDIYVSDSSRVQKFSPSGQFLLSIEQSGPLAVDASGNVWVGGGNRLEEFSSAGVFLSEVKPELPGTGQAQALAIDTDPSSPSLGDFYVVTTAADEVQQISPPSSGTYTLTFEGETTKPIPFNAYDSGANGKYEIVGALRQLPALGPDNVEVAGQTVYFQGALTEKNVPQLVASAGSVATLRDGTPGRLVKLKPNGEPIEALDPSGHPNALGLDPATGSLFVSDQHDVYGLGLSNPATLLEFDSSGAQTEAFGTGEVMAEPSVVAGNSLAFDDGALYVAGGQVLQDFALPLPGPLVLVGSKVTVLHKTSATLSAQVNPEGHATTVHIDYLTEQKFKEDGNSFGAGTVESPESASIGEDFEPHAATLEIAPGELAPATAYRFRAVATNECEPVEHPGHKCTVDGEAAAFTTQPPVSIDSTSSAEVTATSATLNAEIDTYGEPASYHFEYLTEAAYQTNGGSFSGPDPATSVPVPNAQLGSAFEDLPASQNVQGLSPNTVYHYRVVGFDSVGPPEGIDGPDRTFTTQPASSVFALPDGRQWEMVSPPAKFGANIPPVDNPEDETEALVQASADGNAIMYEASSPTEAGAQGFGGEIGMQVFSTRGPDGWVSRDLEVQHSAPAGATINESPTYKFFSEDMSVAVMDPKGPFDPLLSAEASEPTPYVATVYSNGNIEEPCLPATMSCFRPVVTGKAGYADVPPGTVFGRYDGGREGSDCVKGGVCGPWFVTATPDVSHVVFWADAALTPGTKESKQSEHANRYEWSAGQVQPLWVLPGSEGGGIVKAAEGPEQLSNNGSVFFGYGRHLYLRDFARQESLRLDVAQGVAEPGEGDAGLIYASSDGSRVLFSDSQQLTKAAGGGVYECRIVETAGRLSCELELTGLSGGSLVGESEDASYLYFVNAEEKLYVDHYNGREWTSRMITAGVPSGAGPAGMDWRVSRNGEWLAFMSNVSLSGYDNRDATSGQPDEEFYLYHASADGGEGRLVCASCNPTGARPVGGANIFNLAKQRYLSDSGRLFFNSSDALVPQDVNGAEDVYEYEPPGIGGCATSTATYSERSGGCVDLISSGESPVGSSFLDASEGGGDVFFVTNSKLVPEDFDTSPDVYDAHECTAGSPCFPVPAVVPPACTTEASCRAAPTPQPAVFGAPSSATFSGAGNITPTPPVAVKPKAAPKRCGKGTKLKHGRCVKQRAKRHAKKSDRRGR